MDHDTHCRRYLWRIEFSHNDYHKHKRYLDADANSSSDIEELFLAWLLENEYLCGVSSEWARMKNWTKNPQIARK